MVTGRDEWGNPPGPSGAAARVSATRPRRPPRPARAAVAGALVGILLSGAVAATSRGGGDPAPPAVRPADAAAFARAWRRSLEGTYAVTWRFLRRLRSGEQVAYEVRQAQRPPVRLRVGGGTVSWRDATRARACAVAEDGLPRCRDAAARPFDRQVANDMALLAPYVRGPRPLYAVRRLDRGCFDLTLRGDLPAAVYGRRSRFCFDRATGALVRWEVRRADGTDTYEAVEVRARVRDADLEPPPLADEAADRGG